MRSSFEGGRVGKWTCMPDPERRPVRVAVANDFELVVAGTAAALMP